MMKLLSIAALSCGIALGILAALFDVTALSDDASQVTLTLLLAGGAFAGAALPGRLLLCAVIVGCWTPGAHIVVSLLGRPDNIKPDSFLSRLLLLVVCIVAAGVGALVGAFIRRMAASSPDHSIT